MGDKSLTITEDSEDFDAPSEVEEALEQLFGALQDKVHYLTLGPLASLIVVRTRLSVGQLLKVLQESLNVSRRTLPTKSLKLCWRCLKFIPWQHQCSTTFLPSRKAHGTVRVWHVPKWLVEVSLDLNISPS